MGVCFWGAIFAAVSAALSEDFEAKERFAVYVTGTNETVGWEVTEDSSAATIAADFTQTAPRIRLEAVAVRSDFSVEVGQSAYVDYGKAAVFGPNAVVAAIWKAVGHKRNCDFSPAPTCECSQYLPKSMYPTVTFLFPGGQIALSPYFYLETVSETRCNVLIRSHSQPFWVLGAPIFKQFTLKVDRKSQAIAFVESPISASLSHFSWLWLFFPTFCLISAFILPRHCARDVKVLPLLSQDYLSLRIH